MNDDQIRASFQGITELWHKSINQDAQTLYEWFMAQPEHDEWRDAILQTQVIDTVRRLPWDGGHIVHDNEDFPSPFVRDTFQEVLIQSALKNRRFATQSVHADKLFDQFLRLIGDTQ